LPIQALLFIPRKLVRGATLKVIPGARPHGMLDLKDQINAELLAFSAKRQTSVSVTETPD